MAELKHVTGFKELAAAMRELPEELARKALRSAVAAGARVVRDQAKDQAPVYAGPEIEGHPPAGTLQKSIVSKWDARRSSTYRQMFAVVIRAGKNSRVVKVKDSKGKFSHTMTLDAYYWRYLEWGTVNIAPRHFMQRAFNDSVDAAIDAIRETLKQGITDATAKYGKV